MCFITIIYYNIDYYYLHITVLSSTLLLIQKISTSNTYKLNVNLKVGRVERLTFNNLAASKLNQYIILFKYISASTYCMHDKFAFCFVNVIIFSFHLSMSAYQ